MIGILRVWIKNTRGATAIEYGLFIAGIALAIVVALMLMGDSVQTVFSTIETTMSGQLQESQ